MDGEGDEDDDGDEHDDDNATPEAKAQKAHLDHGKQT